MSMFKLKRANTPITHQQRVFSIDRFETGMQSNEDGHVEKDNSISKSMKYTKFILPILGAGVLLAVVVLALCIATLVQVNKKPDEILINIDKPKVTLKPVEQPQDSGLVESIRIDEVMIYLNELQRIADTFNGTRAVNTPGFNATLDYIMNYLTANTNFKVTKNFFYVRNFGVASAPILNSMISNVKKSYNFSSDPSKADFYYLRYSTSINMANYVPLTAIPNVGCTEEDWQKANPPPEGRAVIIKRGTCSFREKGMFAMKYKAVAILLYNDGLMPDRFAPVEASVSQENKLPALFLSFPVGQALAAAAQNPSTQTSVQLVIETKNLPDYPVGNICADTPTGDPTQTIVIGSHSDGVTAGPGINDNGSGAAANLGLAVTLARLFRTQVYPKYKYRVRFCWWGAEELGLLGAEAHVKQAKNSTVVGERLSDYLVNLNYDMLGSPNYMFGIYDGRTAGNDTPPRALPGSNKITALYRDWFIRQKLPWDYTDFTGRSDYGPFLEEGIAAGGLFSGADDIKSKEQRDRYDKMLGQGLGGISGIIHDPCYHRACDTIQNINRFGYKKMVKAAAFALEFLGREDDLKTWLYPPASKK